MRQSSSASRGLPPGFYSNVGWQYMATVWNGVAAFLYSVVLGRGLGLHDFGLAALTLSCVNLLFLLCSLRLNEFVIRYVAEFWEQMDLERTAATIRLSLIADLCCATVPILIVGCLARYAEIYLLRDSRAATVLWLTATSVFFTYLGAATCSGVLRVFGQFRTYSTILMLAATLKTSIAALAVFVLHWDVRGVLALTATASAASWTYCLVTTGRILNRQVSLRRLRRGIALLTPRFGEIRRFLRSTYILSVSGIPIKELDINLLGWFVPLEGIAVYKIAKAFMASVWALSDPTSIVVYPELARMCSRGDYLAVRLFVKRLTVLLGACGAVLFVCTFFGVPIAVQALLGPRFAESGWILRAMVWSCLIWFPLLWVNPLLLAMGRPDVPSRAALWAAAVITISYVISGRVWGTFGVAVVYGFSSPVVLLLVGVFARGLGKTPFSSLDQRLQRTPETVA